jgi:hypothetical protein
MLSGVDRALAHTRVGRAERSSRATGHVTPLQTTIREEVAREGGALQVAVIEGCGVVEVHVSGPTGTLRLRFDRAQLTPAFVRHVLRRKLKAFGASLGCRPGPKSPFRKEARR